jgi:plasmid stabilization system protein ParE
MDYRVVWSPKALDDVEAIGLYISSDSPSYASAVVKKVLDSTRILARFPFAGRIVPEFEDESIREKFVYSYRVIYRIQRRTVTVAAVIHGRRILDLGTRLA